MEIISKQNLVQAAIVGGVAILAGRLLGGKSKLIMGAGTVALVALALPLAAKVQL